MVKLSDDISINLNKLMEFIFPKKEKYMNEKTIYYLRIYTHLVAAENNLRPETFARMCNLLRIVRNMSRTNDFKEEEPYFKRIRDIAHGILSKEKIIKRECQHNDDSHHAKTKLLLAQNICVLRILKRAG